MGKSQTPSPKGRLYIRLLAGGYLMYLAWDLYMNMAAGSLYWIPVILFALIGLVLVVASLRQLIRLNRQSTEEDPVSEE